MTLEKIRDLGVNIEENIYVDYKLYENQTIRIFKDRKNINKLSITKGNKLSGANEIIIDGHFGEGDDYIWGVHYIL